MTFLAVQIRSDVPLNSTAPGIDVRESAGERSSSPCASVTMMVMTANAKNLGNSAMHAIFSMMEQTPFCDLVHANLTKTALSDYHKNDMKTEIPASKDMRQFGSDEPSKRALGLAQTHGGAVTECVVWDRTEQNATQVGCCHECEVRLVLWRCATPGCSNRDFM